MENSSDLRSTFIDCSEPSRLSPIRCTCNKVAYLMIIENGPKRFLGISHVRRLIHKCVTIAIIAKKTGRY